MHTRFFLLAVVLFAIAGDFDWAASSLAAGTALAFT